MAADCVESFIRPIRCLYEDYVTTIEVFKHDNSLLVNGYDIEDLGDDPDLKLYAEFSDEKEGELAREGVQTWICDNRLEVTNCIRIALDNKKESFCNWFRASEQFSSPDELMLYCLAKQTAKHVCIFNAKYVWSTLSNHIKYDYFEVLRKSSVALLFLGPRKYGILRKKPQLSIPNTSDPGKTKPKCGRGRRSSNSTKKPKKKTTCRTTGKKGTSVISPGKRTMSLHESREEKHGIGLKIDTEKYGRGKRASSKTVDYLKLNEGIDTLEDTPTSPKRSKTSSHVPTRSGPTAHRQSAQKFVTVSPTVTTLSSVKSKKEQENEVSPLIGVQTGDPVGRQDTVSDVTKDRPILGVTDAFFGVPDTGNDSNLPDLGSSRDITIADVLNQTQEAHSTEEELDAADTLLSLSNIRDTVNPSLGIDNNDDTDDNALLMPIGGGSIIEDVAPVPLRLEQMDVDEGIARMIASEEHDNLTPLSGVQSEGEIASNLNSGVDNTDTVPVELSGVQESGQDSSKGQ